MKHLRITCGPHIHFQDIADDKIAIAAFDRIKEAMTLALIGVVSIDTGDAGEAVYKVSDITAVSIEDLDLSQGTVIKRELIKRSIMKTIETRSADFP